MSQNCHKESDLLLVFFPCSLNDVNAGNLSESSGFLPGSARNSSTPLTKDALKRTAGISGILLQSFLCRGWRGM